MTLNRKRYTYKFAVQKNNQVYTCTEIRKQTFKSGAEGIVFTFKNKDGNVVRKYDILKNKDGSTLQSQIDTVKKDLNIIDTANVVNLRQVFSGIVIKIQNNKMYSLELSPKGYVQSLKENSH